MSHRMTYRARLVKKARQANNDMLRAQKNILTVMASMLPEHPDREPAFRDILQTIDHARHNLAMFAQSNFHRAVYTKYTRARLNNMIRKAQPLKKYD